MRNTVLGNVYAHDGRVVFTWTRLDPPLTASLTVSP